MRERRGGTAALAGALLGASLLVGFFRSDPRAETAGSREPLLSQRLSSKPPPPSSPALYTWPTTASKIIESTFGDFRRTHFHAGIDIFTGHKIGSPVIASQDGYVSRILVSPTGYGKMLTVRHPDGFSTNYAHLERFEDRIETRVRNEQQQLGRYPVEIECTLGEFPVRRGKVVAYSGDTGTGDAHLHFEIRDESHNPVSPLLFKTLLPSDTIPPAIERIAIRPLGENSLVNSSAVPVIYKPVRLSAHQWHVRDTIHVSGLAGFSLNARDRANSSKVTHGVHSHRLFVDDSLLYAVDIDQLSERSLYQVVLYYDWPLYDAGKGRFDKLYADSPNDFPFSSTKNPASGILSASRLGKGTHRFRIVSADHSDNRSEVTGTLVASDPPHIVIERVGMQLAVRSTGEIPLRRVFLYTRKNGNRKWNTTSPIAQLTHGGKEAAFSISDHECDVVKVIAEDVLGTKSFPQFEFIHKPSQPDGSFSIEHESTPDAVHLALRTNRVFTTLPSLFVYEGGARRVVPLRAVDLDLYVGSFRPLESFLGTRRIYAQAEVSGQRITARKEFDIYPIVRGSHGRLTLDNGNLIIAYDSLSVLKTLFLEVEKHSNGDHPAYSLLPDYTVLGKGLDISLRVHNAHGRQGLLFRGFGTRRLLAAFQSNSDTVLSGKITRTLGTLSTYADNDPPYILGFRVSGASSSRPVISFHFGDALSAIEYNELNMYIDGVPVIPEIDGEHQSAFYRVTHPLQRGSHRVTIRLKDRLGNSSEVEQRFNVR